MQKTKWITAPCDMGAAGVDFEKILELPKPVKRAVLYASAMGVYHAYIDGKKVGDAVLAPGWTAYHSRTQYQEYDVTSLLQNGARLCLSCGQGWAVGCIGVAYTNHFASDAVCAVACLAIEYTDGTRARVETDESWQVYTNEVLFSELYHGETQDKTAKRRLLGKAVVREVKTRLIPQVGEWIREQERIFPVALIRTPKGELVVDFGQNMTGYVELRIRAPRGARIVMHHGEVLDRDGNFYNANYRDAKNELIYICDGEENVFKPRFSFQGFRYIHLVEYPFDEVALDGFCAVAVHSDLRRTGHFVSGDARLNQLYHNIIWGQKSNYLDVPTDCPQRDERLGWTGDTQVFCKTAALNYDVKRFFRKWLGDLACDQGEDGAVYGIVPTVYTNKNGGCPGVGAGWGDAACICPWEIYLAYGDRELLRENFPAMKKWVEYIRGRGEEEYLWLSDWHYGDWLAMDAGGEKCIGATSIDLIASAFYAHSTSLLIKAGEVLGEDMEEYRALYDNILRRFRAYFLPNGQPQKQYPVTGRKSETGAPFDPHRRGDTQTALVLILHFALCEPKDAPRIAAMLADSIRQNGMRMTTGFLGTPYILHALSDNGYTDIAYALLMQDAAPSWLYSVDHGATTMWEHWNSIKEDGSFWSTSMNSFNHYAYGAVYDWIFTVAMGIRTVEDAPGYAALTIAPHPHPALGFAEASLQTAYGEARVKWYYKGDTVYYEITIPTHATATLTLPSGYTARLSGGIYHFAE